MSDKFDEYYENPRPEIQGIVGRAAKRILDVGCGAGSMAWHLKTDNAAEVWGVEPIAAAALKASERLDKVIVASVENAIKQLPDYYFDAIIFADVLEHLVDPYTVLSKMKYKLAPDGFVVTSLPNVRHSSVLRMVLEGNWDYQDYGLMDSTHLRFFTRKSAEQMFTNAGYQTAEIMANVLEAQPLPPGLEDFLRQSGLAVDGLENESKHFQYMIKAYPATQKFRDAKPSEVSPYIESLFAQMITEVKTSNYQKAHETCVMAIDIIKRTQFPQLQPLCAKFESLLLKLKSLKKANLGDEE